MLKVKTEIYHDKELKRPMFPQHEIEISEDKQKARVLNPWNGAWGMAKKSAMNNLNKVVQSCGSENYTIYSLRGMGMKVYFKLTKEEL